jgi:hypothetical protein
MEERHGKFEPRSEGIADSSQCSCYQLSIHWNLSRKNTVHVTSHISIA